MNQKHNQERLQDTVHWRGIKNLLTELCKYESVNATDYNFNKICCYSCVGAELQGTNVVYPSVHHGNSCFVYDNKYDIFEVPAVDYSKLNLSSKFSYTGDYLFLAHDKSFDYWLFGKMNYTVDLEQTAEKGYVVDQAAYAAYGQYKITFTNINDFSFTKEISGEDCNFGGKSTAGSFDRMGSRKKAYHTSSGDIVASSKGKSHNINGLKGGEKVKIYKSKKKTKKTTLKIKY